ncbi:MAG TPA: hypothetical protein VHX44_15035 [Planctomycetota bacterium]|nr:hypothetical protein [Planctomycetota bacterium]
MPAGPDTLMLTMFALIGGLLIFAVLLLLGVRIVRWLKLPQDLPEGPRFEAPPPPSVAKGDRAAAAVIAVAQARLQAVYTEAHAVVRAAAECQDLHQQVNSAGAVEPFAAVAPVTERCSATAITSATAAEQALQAFDRRLRADRAAVADAEVEALRKDLAGHALTAQEALTEARAAVAPLPDGGNRRLILLVGLLVVMIAWVIAMQMLLKK